jgi:hypothetical protein
VRVVLEERLELLDLQLGREHEQRRVAPVQQLLAHDADRELPQLLGLVEPGDGGAESESIFTIQMNE